MGEQESGRNWVLTGARMLAVTVTCLALATTGYLMYRENTWTKPEFRSPEQAFLHGSIGTELVVREKKALYSDRQFFSRVFTGDNGSAYVREVPHYRPEVIACVKDVCRYLYVTHGRVPAHADGLFVPGVWLQAHHLDLSYYDDLFAGGLGYTDTQRQHQARWHEA